MKTPVNHPTSHRILAVAALALGAVGVVHADTVVYFDNFNDQQNVNTGGPYTQTLATTTTTTGGGTWLAGVETGGWGQRDYGDSNVATPTSSNFLAFTPDSGLTYTVQATIDTTPLGGADPGGTNSWFTVGFTSYQHHWNGADGGTIDTANLVRFYSNTVSTITYTVSGSTLATNGIGYVGWITDRPGVVNLNSSQQLKIDNFSLTHNFVNSDVVFTASAAKTVTLTGTNNTLTTGGKIQVDSTVGANLSTVTGGTINAPTGDALVIQQDNTSGGLNVASILNGSNGLSKTGSGTATLLGANTYTGTTTISAGTLALGSTGSLASTNIIVGDTGSSGTVFDVSAISGGYTLASGATLGGKGTLTGATTISAGATLAPGNAGSPAALTVSNDLAFGGSTSVFAWDLNAGTSDPGANTANSGTYDSLVANGTVTGTGKFEIALGSNTFSDAFWDTNKSWTNIFTGSGSFDLSSIFTTFGGSGIASNGSVTGQGQFSFTSNTLSWTPIPELSNVLIGGLLGVGLLRRRRNA